VFALRMVLVALLYLFLALALRAAWHGLRSAPAPPSAVATSLALAVLDPGTSDLPTGRVSQVPDGATLGRAQRADVVVADPTVSAEHARISRAGRGWVVTDLGSTNGTRVNDARVDGETRIAPGDVVVLGNVRLKVLAR
jgi:predicted component of type VI protein secretion system